MNEIIENLRTAGCDIDGAMKRFLNDENMYISFLELVLNEEAFDGLGQALNANDANTAFEYAHTLKGVVGNMGLTLLYNIILDIIKPLRHGEISDLIPKYRDLLAAREQIRVLSNL